MNFAFKKLFWLAFASSAALAQSNNPAFETFSAFDKKLPAAIEKPVAAIPNPASPYDGRINSSIPQIAPGKPAYVVRPSTFVARQAASQSSAPPSLPDQFAPTPLFGPPTAAPHDYSQGHMISYPDSEPFGLSTGQSVPTHGTGPLQSTEGFASEKDLEDFKRRGATPGMLRLIQAAEANSTVCRMGDRSLWTQAKANAAKKAGQIPPPCTSSTKESSLSTGHCYMHVKLALQQAGCIPDTDVLPSEHAKDAMKDMKPPYFTRVSGTITNPREAPPGSIIVYDGAPHGHIEIKSYNDTYISDFIHGTRGDVCMMPILGVFIPNCDRGKL